MKRNRKAWLAWVGLTVMLCWPLSVVHAAALDEFAGLQGTISIAGGTAHIPVMNEAARIIMTHYPNIRITVEGGGSGVGVQKVGEGLVDIGDTGRALTSKEISEYGLKTYPFALDGVAVVVNPDNPVNGLDTQQVQNIFAGKIRNWKALGGKDAPIHLFSRDEASGTREVFWKKLLHKGPIDPAANIVPSNGAMKVAVAQDKNAIGFISIGHIDATVKPVKLNGVMPTQQNAQNGSYPVVRKLYMNTKGQPSKLVKAFIDYILSSAGEAIVKKHGFIPLQ